MRILAILIVLTDVAFLVLWLNLLLQLFRKSQVIARNSPLAVRASMVLLWLTGVAWVASSSSLIVRALTPGNPVEKTPNPVLYLGFLCLVVLSLLRDGKESYRVWLVFVTFFFILSGAEAFFYGSELLSSGWLSIVGALGWATSAAAIVLLVFRSSFDFLHASKIACTFSKKSKETHVG